LASPPIDRRSGPRKSWRLHDEAERMANEAGHAFTIAFVLLHRMLSEAMTANLEFASQDRPDLCRAARTARDCAVAPRRRSVHALVRDEGCE
jgi:hypothetical protein